MALIQCDFFSEVLSLSTSMKVILPQQTHSQIGMDNKKVGDKHPTLYLLHGFSDDETIWTRRTSIERYAAAYGLAIVMPRAEHSFYTDMEYGKKYWSFITEELPRLACSFFPLSEKREDNFVAGLSMGGYGAFKWALNYPERFAAAASLSGVTDMVSHLDKARITNDEISLALSRVFGQASITGTENDLLSLLKANEKQSKLKPLLYQACGTEDFLYQENLNFRDACEQTSFSLTTDFGPGDHNWEYWDDKIQDVLQWLPIRS